MIYKFIGIIRLMSRNNILETVKKILKLMKDKKEFSINQVADELKIQWKTANKGLKFLKDIGMIIERKGDKTYREERLFRLKNS